MNKNSILGLVRCARHNVLLLSHIAILCFVLSGCSVATQPHINQPILRSESFGAMPFRESPYAMPKGLYPITQNQTVTLKHFRFDYDARGRLSRLTFRLGDKLSTPLWYVEPNFYAVPETRFFYNDNERDDKTLTVRYYNAQGRRILNGNVYESRYRLDNSGNPKAMELQGVNGEPVENDRGATRYEWKIAEDGDVLERRYNLEGKLVPAREYYEYEVLKLSYRPDGLLAEATSLDATTLNPKTMGDSKAVKSRFTYNEFGAFRSFELLNSQNTRVMGPFGLAADIATYTDSGQNKDAWFEDEHGEKMPLPWGPYYRKGEYDEHGNRISDRFFNAEMQPINAVFGVHEIRMTFDEKGLNPIRTELYDVNGKLTLFQGRNFASSKSRYDKQGRLLETMFFNNHGEPVVRSDYGIAKTLITYDDKNHSIETLHLDLNGKAVTHLVEGWSTQTIIYDKNGEIISLTQK